MRILVAMSGGVDSSVVAGLLKSQGHEVIGVTMKLWEGPNGEMPETGCCTSADSEDARKVAAKLDIPYYVLDYTASFSENVIDNFVDMYAQGLTPNPCVECNRSVKFDHFIDQAKKLNCEKVATGHYAKIVMNNNMYELHKADYLDKDQSYVLHMLDSQKLENIEFPLGTISKPEVRQIAASLGLKTAFKKDSQDICFVTSDSYRDLINKIKPDINKEGIIFDINGNKIGVHRGIANYTVGQRKGVGVGGQEHPLYVQEVNKNQNYIVLAPYESLQKNKIFFKNINILNKEILNQDLECSAKIRSTQNEISGKLKIIDESGYFLFDEPISATSPGQACVFYKNDQVLGGGWIT